LSIVSFQSNIGACVVFTAVKKRDDLRRRFVKAESTLFKIRYEREISGERERFLQSRDFKWIAVSFFLA
jgi:DNA primase large subunit